MTTVILQLFVVFFDDVYIYICWKRCFVTSCNIYIIFCQRFFLYIYSWFAWICLNKKFYYNIFYIYFNKKTNYYPERWITWLVGRWRTQLIAWQLVNCRTHEHRHFERTLRSTDPIPGPHLAEGRLLYKKLLTYIYIYVLAINKCSYLLRHFKLYYLFILNFFLNLI